MLLARLAPRTARGLLALVAAAAVVVSSPGMPSTTASAEPDSPSEVRALWVLRTSLASPESIAALVRSARDHGVQHAARAGARARRRVLQRRDRAARRASSCASRPASIRSQPSSPRRTLRACGCTRGSTSTWCRARSICRSHASTSSNRHPEWLMVPREIAQDVAKVAADSPAYVGKLARWTRAQTGRARRALRLADRPGRRRLPSDRRARPRHGATPSTASTSTTPDIRTPGSTTAGSRSPSSGPRCGRASIPHGGSNSTRERRSISSPTPMRSRTTGVRSASPG